MYILTIIFLFSVNAFALTHPSCVVTQPTVETTQTQNPTIDFSDKKELEVLTKEHHERIYRKLLAEGVPAHVAKYSKRLELLEKPSVSYKNQPESQLKIDSYTGKFVGRISLAKKFLENNAEYLNEAQQKFGVEKEVIVALMLIESGLGENKGKLKILDALFTMSHPYVSSRTGFFTNELVASFKLLSSNKHFFRPNTMGSWAGAMGYVQFIPSSVLAYAVDGNGDGMIDIINNRVDAIHSAGNYLQKVGWKKNTPILEELSPEDVVKINPCTQNEKPYKNGRLVLGQIAENERYFVVYNNYDSIQKWNRSFLFAYTVNFIANELKSPQ